MAKKVFISILRPPVGTTYYVEGLRFASGVLGGDEEHQVTIAHIGKGVNCALKRVDRSYASEFMDVLPKDSKGHLFLVERESLAEEEIAESELEEGFGVASRDELRAMMLDADITLSF